MKTQTIAGAVIRARARRGRARVLLLMGATAGVLCLGLAGTAAGQAATPGVLDAPGGLPGDNGTLIPSRPAGPQQAPVTSGPPVDLGAPGAQAPRAGRRGTINGTRCTTAKGVRRCLSVTGNRVVREAVTSRRGVTTTTFYDSRGAAVRRCATSRAGQTRCVRVRSARQSEIGANRPAAAGLHRSDQLARLVSHGWTPSLMTPVGRIYLPGGGTCTGTVVGRGLVLTAAHCITDRATKRYIGSPQACAQGQTAYCITFYPAHSWQNVADPASNRTPYGGWVARNYWAPTPWVGQARPDYSLDWALVEFSPNAQGRYPGDVVGSWGITTNLPWADGSRAYIVGYPATGLWATAAGRHGRGQYFCDSRTQAANWRQISSGWEMYADCVMNGGASGGPWFRQKPDGTWTLAGVSQQCAGGQRLSDDVYCVPTSSHLRASYLDNRFLEFWNSVQPQLAVR